jgi:biotin carboxylase
MPDLSRVDDVLNGVTYLARTRDIGLVVALDEYDVLTAATLREHMRLPGMGLTVTRQFRDKLSMRDVAARHGLPVPAFVPLFNHGRIREYLDTVPPPWILKPRMEVSTIGMVRLEMADDLWPRLETLGDRQSHYLLERFIPGDVFHVDSIVLNGEPIFAEAHGYRRPPLEVFHGGGIAISRTLSREAAITQELKALNRSIIAALGMDRGVTHAEFIRAHADAQLYFLEIGARVGGAHTADMVEAATGVNPWREWARLELDRGTDAYRIPEARQGYAAVLVALARQDAPDTSAYQDPEIVHRVAKPHHVGFILASPTDTRIEALIEEYAERMTADFVAAMPPWESKPPV